jgi:signal peptidase I
MKTFQYLTFLLILISCDPPAYHVPSSSMESTIPAGAYIRLSSLKSLNRGEIIIYKRQSDKGTYFVHRMVACPGDSLRISYGQIFINGQLILEPETIQYQYMIETDKLIPDDFFIERGISEYHKLQNAYTAFMTEEIANDLRQIKLISSITRMRLDPHEDGKLYEDFSSWNKDHLGVIYLPRSGDTIEKKDFPRYAKTILDHEGSDITGLNTYQFKRSYCFVMGDNRDNVADSRYIGLIPVDEILGKASILFNLNFL